MELLAVLVLSLKAVVDCLQMLPSPIHRSNHLCQSSTLYIEAACYPKISETILFHQKEDQHKVWITILCSPWSRVLLEKITGFQLIKKFTPFNGTGMFITVFTSAIHPPLWNWDRSSGQQESDIYSWSTVPAAGLRGKYFFLMKTGVMKVANHMVACAATRNNHKNATTFCVDFPRSIWAHLFHFYGVYLLWVILLVVRGYFHFCCGTAVSFICVT